MDESDYPKPGTFYRIPPAFQVCVVLGADLPPWLEPSDAEAAYVEGLIIANLGGYRGGAARACESNLRAEYGRIERARLRRRAVSR